MKFKFMTVVSALLALTIVASAGEPAKPKKKTYISADTRKGGQRQMDLHLRKDVQVAKKVKARGDGEIAAKAAPTVTPTHVVVSTSVTRAPAPVVSKPLEVVSVTVAPAPVVGTAPEEIAPAKVEVITPTVVSTPVPATEATVRVTEPQIKFSTTPVALSSVPVSAPATSTASRSILTEMPAYEPLVRPVATDSTIPSGSSSGSMQAGAGQANMSDEEAARLASRIKWRDERPKWDLNAGAEMWFNQGVTFGGGGSRWANHSALLTGNFLNRVDLDRPNRNYDDGSIQENPNGPNTSSFSYVNSGQIQGNKLTLSATDCDCGVTRNVVGTGPGSSEESPIGPSIQLSRSLHRRENGAWDFGLEGTATWMPLESETSFGIRGSETKDAFVTTIVDQYQVTGGTPQSGPYQYFGQGGAFTIGNQPIHRDVTTVNAGSQHAEWESHETAKFNADIFAFRLGPNLQWTKRLNEKAERPWEFSVRGSGGLALGIASGDYEASGSLRQSINGGAMTEVASYHEKDSGTDFLVGWFAGGGVGIHKTLKNGDRLGLVVQGGYQDMGTYQLGAAKADLKGGFARAALSWEF